MWGARPISKRRILLVPFIQHSRDDKTVGMGHRSGVAGVEMVKRRGDSPEEVLVVTERLCI